MIRAAVTLISLFISSLVHSMPRGDSTAQSIPICAAATSGENYPLPLLGNDLRMVKLRQDIELIGPQDVTVLITGETGTGKEVVARALHALSKRKHQPLVTQNMASIPESLAESILFGYAANSFTGADKAGKPGLFERGDGGTVFLDEMGDMHPNHQAKLLRVLQNGEIDVVGGSTRHANFRLIAATNTEVEEAVLAGKFRKDLYYRINVIRLKIPPLRERKGDIPLLVSHFCQAEAEKIPGSKVKHLSSSALEMLAHYDWPGNVRELKTAIESAYIWARDEDVIQSKHIPERIREGIIAPVVATDPGWEPITLDELHRRHILRVLDENSWNKAAAAVILGIERSTLDRRLKRWKIERP